MQHTESAVTATLVLTSLLDGCDWYESRNDSFSPGKESSSLLAGYVAGWTPESVWTIWGGRNPVSPVKHRNKIPRYSSTQSSDNYQIKLPSFKVVQLHYNYNKYNLPWIVGSLLLIITSVSLDIGIKTLRLPSYSVLLWVNFTFMLPCIVINFFLNNQPDALIIPILSGYKTLRVSGILSAHHQEFSTSALVSFMQVFDDRFQAE